MTRCGKCDKELASEPPGVERAACPFCGCTRRAFSRSVSEDVGDVTETLSWVQGRGGAGSHADLDDKNDIRMTVVGPSPRNEEGALEACSRLVRKLNRDGADWTEPVAASTQDEVDATSHDRRDPARKMAMQVVRVTPKDSLSNTPMWQRVSRDGAADVGLTAADAARDLMDAIEKKSKKYPAAQKAELTLVIDVSSTVSHTFRPVFDAFAAQHLDACRSAGFAAVWAIGSTDELVARLDVRSS